MGDVTKEGKSLLTKEKIDEWRFPKESIIILENLVGDLEEGKYLP